MTTTYPAQTYTVSQNNQLPLYGGSRQPSPTNSTSPTSPRLNDHMPHYNPNPAKQLRPLKSPLYVPAVLRPTEHFTTSPMTPPKSAQASVENVQEERGALPGPTDLDLFLEAEHGGGDEELEDVTGPPTREHWKPDNASPNCDSPQCRSNFNLFVRKHHCRHCGHIFCSSHVNHSIPLDQSAKFHPDGHKSRVCETCHRQYQKWDTSRSVRRKNSDNSEESSQNLGSAPASVITEPRSGHRRMMSAYRSGSGDQPQHRQQSMANSVPKDWAWSTF